LSPQKIKLRILVFNNDFPGADIVFCSAVMITKMFSSNYLPHRAPSPNPHFFTQRRIADTSGIKG
jgi:hypothetical protein